MQNKLVQNKIQGAMEHFEQVYYYINHLDYQGKKDFYDFYINYFGGDPKLSKKEKILYNIE